MIYDEEDINAVAAYLKEHPHASSVPEIAGAVKMPETIVVEILDREQPEEGWIPDDIAKQYRTEQRDRDDQFIGYRWPDESLREEPFDNTNPEHLDEMHAALGI